MARCPENVRKHLAEDILGEVFVLELAVQRKQCDNLGQSSFIRILTFKLLGMSHLSDHPHGQLQSSDHGPLVSCFKYLSRVYSPCLLSIIVSVYQYNWPYKNNLTHTKMN